MSVGCAAKPPVPCAREHEDHVPEARLGEGDSCGGSAAWRHRGRQASGAQQEPTVQAPLPAFRVRTQCFVAGERAVTTVFAGARLVPHQSPADHLKLFYYYFKLMTLLTVAICVLALCNL